MKITVHESESNSFPYGKQICTVIRHNYPLLHALHLDPEDVYQDLAITAIQASSTFDPRRSDSLEAYMYMKLQYAILDIKRDYQPAGLTRVDGARTRVSSLEYCLEHGLQVATAEYEESDSDLRLREALSRLDLQERQVVLLYLEDKRPRREQETALSSAFRKLRDFYLSQPAFC